MKTLTDFRKTVETGVDPRLISCKLYLNERLKEVRNDLTLSLHSPMVNLI